MFTVKLHKFLNIIHMDELFVKNFQFYFSVINANDYKISIL